MRIDRKFCLLMLHLPALALAQTVQCTDKPECWPEDSAMRVGLSLHQQQNSAEKKMAAKHTELLNLVSSSATNTIVIEERLINALKSQQGVWTRYRNEECELIGSLTGAGGAWPSTWAAKCEANHTDQRLRRIRSAISCIKKIPNDIRFAEQNRCLERLAPLTNR